MSKTFLSSLLFFFFTSGIILGANAAQPLDAVFPQLDTVKKANANNPKEQQKKIIEAFWKNSAEIIANTKDVSAADYIADMTILLAPVINEIASSTPEKAGSKLAQILSLPQDKPITLNSFQDLTKFSKEIKTVISLERLKLLALHYDYEAMTRSIEHLAKKYPAKYKSAADHLATLREFQKNIPNVDKFIAEAKSSDISTLQKLVNFRLRALYYENPEIDYSNYVAVRRFAKSGKRSHRHEDRPANWQGISSMPNEGKFYQSEIVAFPSKNISGKKQKVFTNDRWIGHLDLNFDGNKLTFTTNGFNKEEKRPWDVYELDVKSGKTIPLTAHMPTDTDSYDSCYLPDGRLLFINTSGYQGVPCVSGSDYVGNIHLLDRKKNSTRRLTLDQDNNWSPTLLSDGRVMFLRWEYTESAHYFSRVLMHMNPDGSDQKEYYGSNSYWPNCIFGAKAIPGKPGMFVGTVSGHHGEKRVGELVIFDINRGRKETEGAVQKIPGYGKEVPNITKDQLVNGLKTPLFAEPYPFSENYFLAASNLRPGEQSMNIVFCDNFDNIVPLTSSRYFIYGEPRPLHAKTKPPVIPDRVNLTKSTATAYITDVYEGQPMKGVPRGEAKSIRVFMSEYSPRNTGSHYAMGMESNWDLKILYGTAPVEEDGSAMFEVPANQPITVQVLDKDGKALSWMRSWFTAMPGETLSCVGCHENQNDAPPAKFTIASRKRPVKLTPWKGDARTFSFLNEVQPVLDRNCIACHNADSKEKSGVPDFASLEAPKGAPAPGSISYWNLHPYTRRNGPEGDYQGLKATEFTTDTSELIQLLTKGHHNVKLTSDDWDRLNTWIDMNVPYLGYWPGERNAKNMDRRYELHKQFTTITRDYTTMDDSKYQRGNDIQKEAPAPEAAPSTPPVVKGFPFTVNKDVEQLALDLGNNVSLKLRRIPAGQFVMGSNNETPSERPMNAVTISKPYWMGETEVTLEQYKQFDPTYENGWYDMHYKDQVRPGYDMNNPSFPVIRVTWEQAMEFCQWLSRKTGKKVTLPTEAQWEYAARGGSDTPFFYGNLGEDFSPYANLADIKIKEMAVSGIDPKPMKNPNRFYDFIPRDEKYNDGVLHLASVGKYQPNPFKLHDMIGNVAEWTRSEYRPYPWNDADGRNGTANTKVSRVVRGGSWRDRPVRATASWRWGYPGWRPVYNVGFRVIIED